MSTYYARTVEGRPKSAWQILHEHLDRVADRASASADVFGSRDWGYCAGLWHDLGKYSSEFQAKLDGKQIQFEHSGVGAAFASARLVTSDTQTLISDVAYAPYGEDYADSGGYLQFTSGSAGELTVAATNGQGLNDFDFRKYSPVQGRWISPDPAGLAAVNPLNPQTWNRYNYVTNYPTGAIDPLGLWKSDAFGGGLCIEGPFACGGAATYYLNGIQEPAVIAQSLLSSGVALNCGSLCGAITTGKQFSGNFGGSFSLVAADSRLTWVNNLNRQELSPGAAAEVLSAAANDLVLYATGKPFARTYGLWGMNYLLGTCSGDRCRPDPNRNKHTVSLLEQTNGKGPWTPGGESQGGFEDTLSPCEVQALPDAGFAGNEAASVLPTCTSQIIATR